MPNDRTYTINEAAALTGMHRNTIRMRIKMGQLEATVQPGKFGDEYRISHAALVRARLLPDDGPLGSAPVDGALEAELVETPVPEGDTPPPDNGALRDSTVTALGELYQRHEQAMFRLGYLQGELERLKALADTAESLREDNAARAEELRSLKAALEEKEEQATRADMLRTETERLRQELDQARSRLQEMSALREDIEHLKTQVTRKRPWWQFWSD